MEPNFAEPHDGELVGFLLVSFRFRRVADFLAGFRVGMEFNDGLQLPVNIVADVYVGHN